MNMRNLVLIFCLAINLTVFAQDDDNSSKWQSQVFIDLNASNKSSYEYYDTENKARETSINGKGSLELAYNIDYRIFRKFSVSGIASLTNYNNPSFASIKTGLRLAASVFGLRCVSNMLLEICGSFQNNSFVFS